MREILFKAKRIDNGEWVEGFYVRQEETSYCFKEDYERHPENTKHYIVFDMMTDWGLPNKHLIAEIDPETLCQYTGMKDKNANRIWENDIVRLGEEMLVKWSERYAGWCLSQNKWMFEHFFGEAVDETKCEVIGNIFDNPDEHCPDWRTKFLNKFDRRE